MREISVGSNYGLIQSSSREAKKENIPRLQ